MEFRIADTFTYSLARLTRDAQELEVHPRTEAAQLVEIRARSAYE